MIFQPGADNLLAIEKIFGPDEAHHGVDQQRLESPRDGVSPGFAGLLIHAMMGVGRQHAPCPVSKYITFFPTVPRSSASAASWASASSARLMPKLLLAASVPAMD